MITMYMYRHIGDYNKRLNVYVRDNHIKKCKEARQQGDKQPLPIMGWFAIPNTTALHKTLSALGWDLQHVVVLPTWLNDKPNET